MESKITDISIYEKIANHFNALANKEKWGESVASHALVASRALNIIRYDDIKQIKTVSSYDKWVTIIITECNVVCIKHAYFECNHTRVTVGAESFIVTDRDSFAVFM